MPQPKKSTARKPAARKPAAKAAAARKATRKPAAKKATARKSAAKPAAKKATARKTATRKPAAKKAAARKSTARKPAARRAGARSGGDPVSRGISSIRDLLTRSVLLTSERVQEALDDAVDRGRVTRHDAEELVQTLVSSGRRQAQDALSDLEKTLRRSGAADVTERVRKQVDQIVSSARRR